MALKLFSFVLTWPWFAPRGEPIVDGYPWWWHCQSVEASCLLPWGCQEAVSNLGFPCCWYSSTVKPKQTHVEHLLSFIVEVLVQLHMGFDWHNGWVSVQHPNVVSSSLKLNAWPVAAPLQISVVDSHAVFWVSFSLLLSPVESRIRLQKSSFMLSTPVDISTVHLPLVVRPLLIQSLKIMLTCMVKTNPCCRGHPCWSGLCNLHGARAGMRSWQSKGVTTFVFNVLGTGLLRYILSTCPNV